MTDSDMRYLLRRIAVRLRALRREKQRRLAASDPNAFVEYVLTDPTNEPLRQGEIHQLLQTHLSDNPYALVKYPRDHGKTTQVLGRSIWELGRNPDLRIKIVCAKDELATRRVATLKRLIERNPYVQRVFPTLSGERDSWARHGFTVKRQSYSVDLSVEAYGVLSSATGGRADLLILDDVTDDRNSLYSAARRQEVIDAIDNKWLNLVHPTTSRVWWIGTPWHFDDALERKCHQPEQFALLERRIRPDMAPIWPERWPQDRLEAHKGRIGETAFARGFYCLPISTDEQVIRPEWVRFWRPDELPKRLEYYIGVDPAFSASSKADETAIVVVGVHKRAFYVVEAVHSRGLTLQSLLEKVSSLSERYKPKRIGVEAVQAQVYIVQELKRRTRVTVKDVKTSKDKHARMTLLADHFEDGRVYLRGNGLGPHKSQQVLYEQLTQFPAADHDDLCDALDFAIEQAIERSPRIEVW